MLNFFLKGYLLGRRLHSKSLVLWRIWNIHLIHLSVWVLMCLLIYLLQVQQMYEQPSGEMRHVRRIANMAVVFIISLKIRVEKSIPRKQPNQKCRTGFIEFVHER